MTDREPIPCTAQRDAICAKTGELIKTGEDGYWVKRVGIFKERPTAEEIDRVLRNEAVDELKNAGKQVSAGGGPTKRLIKGDLV
jgi:hypothetical protein